MKRGVVVGMVVLLMLVGLGCFGFVFAEVGAKQKAPIRIAFNTWIGYASFYIAEEKGFFKKRGIAVETKVIDPLAEKNAAMIRGDLDGMGGTIDSAVISATSGVKGKVVFMFDRSNGTDGILVTEEVKTVKDLKGVSVSALKRDLLATSFCSTSSRSMACPHRM